MRDYEMVWILGSAADEKEGEESAKKMRSVIVSLGGEVQEIKPWGRRNLAYPINKNSEGFYLETAFKMEPSRAAEFERAIATDRAVIRHLIVKR